MYKHLRHLAWLGYIAVMPNLYSDGGMRKCLIGTLKSLRSGRGRAYADIEASRQRASTFSWTMIAREPLEYWASVWEADSL